jgi:hypothetical protein
MRYVRILLIIVVLFTLTALASASVPTSMTVQGRLTDASGTPLPAGTKTLTFKIYDAESNGNEIWPGGGGESQSVASDAAGLWTTRIGALISLTDDVFSDTTRWLEITVDDGVNPVTTLPRIRLVTGPFAYRVATVDGASGGAITSKTSIGPGHSNPGTDAFVAGADNTASGDYSTVGGGTNNKATGNYSVVSGGGSTSASDSNSASGFASAIGGGKHNVSSSDYCTVAGGQYNTASGSNAVVGGGIANEANNSGATIAGGTVNVSSGQQAAVAGGSANLASGDGSAIAGGNSNVAADSMSVVGGGGNNKARGAFSVIAGGGGTDDIDSNLATGRWSTISGGQRSIASGGHSVVSGGGGNLASGDFSTIGGGTGNTATEQLATVAGGYINDATAIESFVGGGRNNTASGYRSTVGGGYFNLAEDTCATCSGGRSNAAIGAFSVVAGGGGPDVATEHNEAQGHHCSIGGGQGNTAFGRGGAIPGGEHNTANGNCSFAAGHRAKAIYDGSFVWADTSEFDYYAATYNQFCARATGGVQFVVAIDGSGNPTWTADLAAGGSWSYTSDSTLKENFEAVDGADLLEQLRRVPVTRWNAKSQDDAIKHIGPMAQDFYAAFGLGNSDRQITTSDICGIALAAIKELDKRTHRIEALESELAELRQTVAALENHGD